MHSLELKKINIFHPVSIRPLLNVKVASTLQSSYGAKSENVWEWTKTTCSMFMSAWYVWCRKSLCYGAKHNKKTVFWNRNGREIAYYWIIISNGKMFIDVGCENGTWREVKWFFLLIAFSLAVSCLWFLCQLTVSSSSFAEGVLEAACE